MKRNSVTGLITGLSLTAIGFAISSLLTDYHTGNIVLNNGLEKIEWRYYLYYIMITLALFGIAVIITACFCLFFGKTVSKYCKLKTSAISLALSAIVALGLFCLMLFSSCFAFTDPKYHPITFPSSFILGSISFLIFIALLFKYAKLKKYNHSAKAIAIDMLFSFLYVIPFFMLYNTVVGFISDVMHITGII